MSLSHLLLASASLVAILLVIGFLTPIASVVACLAGIANPVTSPELSASLLTTSIFTILNAGALALLGPGDLLAGRPAVWASRDDRCSALGFWPAKNDSDIFSEGPCLVHKPGCGGADGPTARPKSGIALRYWRGSETPSHLVM